MTGEKVLIDTSVWIEYLRGASGNIPVEVDALLASGRAVISGVILAELLHGARDKKEVEKLESLFDALDRVETNDELWKKAGRVANDLRKSGYSVNLTDCLIAMIALENGLKILTLDKHFKEIEKGLKRQLLVIF